MFPPGRERAALVRRYEEARRAIGRRRRKLHHKTSKATVGKATGKAGATTAPVPPGEEAALATEAADLRLEFEEALLAMDRRILAALDEVAVDQRAAFAAAGIPSFAGGSEVGGLSKHQVRDLQNTILALIVSVGGPSGLAFTSPDAFGTIWEGHIARKRLAERHTDEAAARLGRDGAASGGDSIHYNLNHNRNHNHDDDGDDEAAAREAGTKILSALSTLFGAGRPDGRLAAGPGRGGGK